jgi:hypothetical protein
MELFLDGCEEERRASEKLTHQKMMGGCQSKFKIQFVIDTSAGTLLRRRLPLTFSFSRPAFRRWSRVGRHFQPFEMQDTSQDEAY